MLTRIVRHCAALLVAVTLVAGFATPSGAATLPVIYSSIPAIAAAIVHPGGSPLGANDWNCKPSAAHPNPVVLVHGTFANMAVNWNTYSPLLKNEGYCVFALNYGGLILGEIGGTGPIESSAAELSAFVDRVLSATGASKVDVVGHSQGGMMPRYYLKFLGGASKVRTLVGFAPSNHGTTVFGLTALLVFFPWLVGLVIGSWCQACTQQLAGSTFLQQLNAGGDTVPGVNYTVIETVFDEVVTPYTSAFLSGPNVRNIKLQDQCWVDWSEHLAIAFDHIAATDMLNALDPAHPRSIKCTPVLPILGG